MRSFFARVEQKFVVGVDVVNFLATTSLIFIQRHRGMKRPGPTLHVIVHETGSTTDMQLVLHKWLAGVCLSYYSQYLI